MENKPNAIMALVAHGADVEDTDILCRQTALEWAADLNRPEVVFTLLYLKQHKPKTIDNALKNRQKKEKEDLNQGTLSRIKSMLSHFDDFKQQEAPTVYSELMEHCKNYQELINKKQQ